MIGFIEGECRTQATLSPERLDDYITRSWPVGVIDVFVDESDLGTLSFRTVPEDTGRSPYHPATMLIEHGIDQPETIRNLLDTKEFINIETLRDLAGLERVSYAQKPA